VTLHILSASPFATDCLGQCRQVTSAGDALLLTADGVYAVLGEHGGELQRLHAAGVRVYALTEDCRARGIDGRLPAFVGSVDYGGFVDLAAEHPRSMSWF
jgi:tRNA 2-thiouridine synthesizing protein B